MQKEKNTFSIIFSFAEQKKSKYIASVILAVVGAIFQILPYFVMADIIGKLLSGNRELKGYLRCNGCHVAAPCVVPFAFDLAVPSGNICGAWKYPQAGT